MQIGDQKKRISQDRSHNGERSFCPLILLKLSITKHRFNHYIRYLDCMQRVKHLNIQVQKLDIIFVSDIHKHKENLDKLAAYVRSNGLNFDYCIVGGDVVNCDHTHKTHSEEH